MGKKHIEKSSSDSEDEL